MGNKVTVFSQKTHAEQKLETYCSSHFLSFSQIQALVCLMIYFSGRLSAFVSSEWACLPPSHDRLKLVPAMRWSSWLMAIHSVCKKMRFCFSPWNWDATRHRLAGTLSEHETRLVTLSPHTECAVQCSPVSAHPSLSGMSWCSSNSKTACK